MAEYATRNPVLVAAEPTSKKDGIRNLARLCAIISSVFAAVFLLGYLMGEEPITFGGIFVALGLAYGINLIVFLLFLWATLTVGMIPRRVHVQDGVIEIVTTVSSSRQLEWDDSDVRFFERGMADRLTCPRDYPYITVVCRGFVKRLVSPHRIAVKMTPEMGKIWKGLLSLQPEG